MIYSGVVYDQDGQELPGVKIQAYDAKTGMPAGQPVHTGAQGSWEMDLASGKTILYFYAAGFLSYGVAAQNAAELTMKPGTGYEPQPGELLPVTKSNADNIDWKFWLLLAIAVYGISKT